MSAGQDAQTAERHYQRALELEAAGNVLRAEEELKAAHAERPKEDRYIRALTMFYIEGGRYGEATQVIRGYVRHCGTTALGYELEGELLFKQRLYDAALQAVRRSLELSDKNARMHEVLALLCVIKRQDSAAVPELRRAAELSPNQPQIRYWYGRVLYSTGRYSEARDQFLACLKIHPGYPKASENLGLCYEALGQNQRSARAYEEGIALEEKSPRPRRGEPYAFYGALLAKLDQPQKALPILRQGVAASPQSFVVNYELGRVLLRLGSFQEAERALLQAAKLAPEFPRTYYLLGELCQKQNRPAEAQQYWTLFRKLNKEAPNGGFPVTDR